MKDRILKLIQQNNLTTGKFAEEIGVQPSAISHILSGRNNPGYELITKILLKYPKINAEWLLLGHGAMYKSLRQTSIFDELNESPKVSDQNTKTETSLNEHQKSPISNNDKSIENNSDTSFPLSEDFQIERIVIFFKNKSFKEYLPT